MKERLKQLRKKLNMTQQLFANRLGMSRATYSMYESGRSEPGTAGVSLICRTFGVSEKWLRYGEGEMFSEADEEGRLLELANKVLPDEDKDFRQALVKAIVKLTPSQARLARDFVLMLAEHPKAAEEREDPNISGTKKTLSEPDAQMADEDPDPSGKDMDESGHKAEDYRQSVIIEKKAAVNSSAVPGELEQKDT